MDYNIKQDGSILYQIDSKFGGQYETRKNEILVRKNSQKSTSKIPRTEQLEIQAIGGIHKVRKIVGTAPHGNMLYGMSGQFDMALMQHLPTELGEILIRTISQTSSSYKKTSNGLIPAQIFLHMQRIGGHNYDSIDNFKKPFAKFGHEDKANILTELMNPLLSLYEIYDSASSFVK